MRKKTEFETECISKIFHIKKNHDHKLESKAKKELQIEICNDFLIF